MTVITEKERKRKEEKKNKIEIASVYAVGRKKDGKDDFSPLYDDFHLAILFRTFSRVSRV
jgi:hypothetical protein